MHMPDNDEGPSNRRLYEHGILGYVSDTARIRARNLFPIWGLLDVEQSPETECFENGVHLAAGLDSSPG